MIHVDSTTADPASTRSIGADYAAHACAMVDGPLGRTPLEAEAGKLSTFLGGDAGAIARVRPIVESYADTIIDARLARQRAHAEAGQQLHLDRDERGHRGGDCDRGKTRRRSGHAA